MPLVTSLSINGVVPIRLPSIHTMAPLGRDSTSKVDNGTDVAGGRVADGDGAGAAEAERDAVPRGSWTFTVRAGWAAVSVRRRSSVR